MLPSLMERSRVDRERELRRMLWEHVLEGDRCKCGFPRPAARRGPAWHVEHLARYLADR